MTRDADVVVVGAGLAGLTAAREVRRAGLSAIVVEARCRVGGRTLSQDFDGHRVDLGGQWIGPGQDRMARLARELGVATFPTWSRGRKVLDVGGKVTTYAGTIPSLAPHQLLLMHHTLGRVERLRKRVPLDAPASAEGAAALDGVTVGAWLARNVPSKTVRDVVEAGLRVIFGTEASELSLLWFLFYANAAGGFMKLIEIERGAQQDRFVLGAQEVALRLAADLGGAVELSSPVRRIVQDEAGVSVVTDKGTRRASYAIVAVPPALAGRIDHEPPLPAARDALTQRMPMGATIKCIAGYERPFWRDRGLSGEAVSTGSPVVVVFDDSPPDGSRGALVAFVVGGPARAWGRRSADDRRRAVTGDLVRFFGPEASHTVAYVEQDWQAEPWTRGCPTGSLPPAALSLFGASLREPVGRVHWAGTETATEHAGYMEGALQSGERAAAEVVARVGRPR